MQKPKILLSWPLDTSQFSQFSDQFEIDALESHDDRYQKVCDRIHEYDGLLSISIPVDENLLRKAKNLKVVANFGVGYDNIDTASATMHNIAVSNTPVSTTNPTANYTMALMLDLMRKVSEHNMKLKTKSLDSWYGRKMLGDSIEGKTLGIIGIGRIGKAVAQRANAFGLDIIYHNRSRLSIEEEKEYQCQYVTLDDLLSNSDIVSLHCPLSDATRDLINTRELNLMKSKAYLINTARGGIVNELALINHLKEKKIAGAAMDVYKNEPNPRSEFFDLENTLVTPHNGTGTHEARDNMMAEALGNIMAFLVNKPMTSRVA